MKPLRVISIAGMLAILSLLPAQAWAQKHTETGKATSITGCLAKGDQANEYKITENGVTYDLYPTGNLNMADHVGHKVTVTGKNANPQASGTKTSSGATEERLEVTHIKHVSKTCP